MISLLHYPQTFKTFIIVCIFTSPFSNQLVAQDLIDTKLKKIELMYNKCINTDKILFDRYNCIFHIGDAEINMSNVK